MLREYEGNKPQVHSSAFLSKNCLVIGKVSLSENVSVWPGCVLRADVGEIIVNANTNLQDGVMVHPNHDLPVIIGKNVTVGHGAIIHGCRIGNNCLVGMGAIILDGAVIEDNCIIGAGALVPERMRVSEGSLMLGIPAKTARRITQDDLSEIYRSAEEYIGLAEMHRKNTDDTSR